MSQDLASFGDLDVQQSDQEEEADFGALEVQQAQVLFSALKAIQNGTPSTNWTSEAAAEIEGIKERTTQAATATEDYIARRAVLLMTKRDLADLCMEGLIESTEQQQQQKQLAQLLQGLREYQNDTLDDWRNLLEQQEQRTRFEIEGSKATLTSAEDKIRELLALLADERAHRVLYGLKSKMIHIELEQSEAHIKELEQLAPQANLSLDNQVTQRGLLVTPLPEESQAKQMMDEERVEPAKEVVLLSSAKSPKWRVASSRSGLQGDWALRGLTLHQLKDTIHNVYVSKAKADARALEQRQPYETMEQHLISYLTTKYGVRQLIMQWLTSILAAVEHFTPLDADTALFGKVLRNEVEEQFQLVQQRVASSAAHLLQSILQAQYPLMPTAAVSDVKQQLLKGSLDQGLWQQIVQGLCNNKDMAEVSCRIRAAALAHQTSTGGSLLRAKQSCAWGHEKGSETGPCSIDKPNQPVSVPFIIMVQVILRWNLELHERALGPISEAFKLVDDHKLGRLCMDQFFRFCHLVNPAIRHNEVATLLSSVAHSDSGVVTFSSCAHALMTELTKMQRGT